MSIEAVSGASAASATPSSMPAAATPARGTGEPRFATALQHHLDQPRRDIAAVRSEIAAIRAGAPLWRTPSTGIPGNVLVERQALLGVPGAGRSPAAGASPSAPSPAWVQAQLLPQATGNAADPYGWRAMTRQIGEQLIGPGYGALFERQIEQESGFAPDVVYGARVSSAGAQGIAQLMPQFYPHVDRLNPRAALIAGAQTMRENLAATGGDVRKAVAAYNCGLGRVQQLVAAYGAGWEAGLPAETKSYLAAILGPAAPRFEPAPPAEAAAPTAPPSTPDSEPAPATPAPATPEPATPDPSTPSGGASEAAADAGTAA